MKNSEHSLLRKILTKTAVLFSIPLIFIYVVFPLLFILFPYFMQHIFFLNFLRNPFQQYNDLSQHGINSMGINFYLKNGLESKLGVWHILPQSLSNKYHGKNLTLEEFEDLLKLEDYKVFLYLHGNTFDRTTPHRCALYNVLSSADFHVIAFDYRGYGDSTGRPTDEGLASDAVTVYKHLLKFANGRIYVWGHSMGTGVACNSMKKMSKAGIPPKGIILESPFNNLRDVILNHPLSKPFKWIPFQEQLFIGNLKKSGLIMDSDKHIKEIDAPILILHAEDDHVIPWQLGEKLHQSAIKAGKQSQYIKFESRHQFKHKFLYRANEIPDLVKKFVQS
uniref:AB hydrolase-1 domain-containing protein n=1 Tax=Strongyloides venezuelensis TaxID=75913 RepID=A0A0K0FVL8_STRVS